MIIDKADFSAYVDEVIEPKLKEFSKDKAKIIDLGKKYKIGYIIMIIFCYLYGCHKIFLEIGGDDYLLYGSLAIPVGAIFIEIIRTKPPAFAPLGIRKKGKRRYKYEIVRESIYDIDNRFVYKPLFKTSRKQIVNSGLFKSFERYTEDDGIILDGADYKIRISELHLKSMFKKVFDGIFIRIIFRNKAEESVIKSYLDEVLDHYGDNLIVNYSLTNINIGVPIESVFLEMDMTSELDANLIKDLGLIVDILSVAHNIQQCTKS
ncbi:MAG: hypothetical protein N4A72_04680 [Bacteroidales bacterium]|jgi:hypothetical protein|nr:hypothetical protein [Bacteroidales bacterium]